MGAGGEGFCFQDVAFAGVPPLQGVVAGGETGEGELGTGDGRGFLLFDGEFPPSGLRVPEPEVGEVSALLAKDAEASGGGGPGGSEASAVEWDADGKACEGLVDGVGVAAVDVVPIPVADGAAVAEGEGEPEGVVEVDPFFVAVEFRSALPVGIGDAKFGEEEGAVGEALLVELELGEDAGDFVFPDFAGGGAEVVVLVGDVEVWVGVVFGGGMPGAVDAEVAVGVHGVEVAGEVGVEAFGGKAGVHFIEVFPSGDVCGVTPAGNEIAGQASGVIGGGGVGAGTGVAKVGHVVVAGEEDDLEVHAALLGGLDDVVEHEAVELVIDAEDGAVGVGFPEKLRAGAGFFQGEVAEPRSAAGAEAEGEVGEGGLGAVGEVDFEGRPLAAAGDGVGAAEVEGDAGVFWGAQSTGEGVGGVWAQDDGMAGVHGDGGAGVPAYFQAEGVGVVTGAVRGQGEGWIPVPRASPSAFSSFDGQAPIFGAGPDAGKIAAGSAELADHFGLESDVFNEGDVLADGEKGCAIGMFEVTAVFFGDTQETFAVGGAGFEGEFFGAGGAGAVCDKGNA